VHFLSLKSSLGLGFPLSLEAIGLLQHPGVLVLWFTPWKFEIRVLGENKKETSFLQHINSLTCIQSYDDM
jgi:hypothetical protein